MLAAEASGCVAEVEIHDHANSSGSRTVVARVPLPRTISFAALRAAVASIIRSPPDSFMLALAQEGELGGPRLRLVLHPITPAPQALIVPPPRPIILSKPRSKSFGGPQLRRGTRTADRRRSLPVRKELLSMDLMPFVRPLRSGATAPRSLSVWTAPPTLKAFSVDSLTSALPRPDTPPSTRRPGSGNTIAAVHSSTTVVTGSSSGSGTFIAAHPSEEEVNSDGLVLRKGELVSATSDGLLGIVLGANAPPPETVDETLLTYRYWAAPASFLALLAARFDAFGAASGELRGVLRLRVLSTMRRWVEAFFHDFERDEILLNRLLDFVDHALKTTHGTQLAKWSEKLKLFVHEQVNTTLTRKFPTHYLPLLLADDMLAARSGAVTGAALMDWMCANLKIARQKALIVGNQFTPRFFVPAAASKEQFFRDSREAMYVVQRAGATAMNSKEEEEDTRPKVLSKHRTPDDCSLSKVHATELARQLTLVEHELFRAIEPPELLFANWKRDAKRDLAPHVCAVIDHFNRTLRWATTEILLPPSSKLRRAALVKLLQVGIEFKKLNNFNGIMEIVSALQSAPIQRLKATWRGLQAKESAMFQELVDTMDFVHHLKKYRDELEKIEPPALPYIGLFLQDLLMIEEIPTRSRHDAGLINVSKLRKVAGVVRRIQRLQARPYLLKPQPAVHAWLASATVLSDADIEQISRTAESV